MTEEEPASRACLRVPRNARGGIYRGFGRAVREGRRRRGLTQAQLAAAVRTHRNYVGAVERGEMNPTLRVIAKLSRGLLMQPSELLLLAEQHHGGGWQDADTYDAPRRGLRS